MNKFLLVFWIVIINVHNVLASEVGMLSLIKGDTRKVTNGRYWESLSNEAKMSYLLGMGEGEFEYSAMLTTSNIAKEFGVNRADLQKLDGMVLNKINNAKNTGEIMWYLNNFYSEPLNINIPIHFALTTLSLTQHGGDVKQMIQLLRENSEAVSDKAL